MADAFDMMDAPAPAASPRKEDAFDQLDAAGRLLRPLGGHDLPEQPPVSVPLLQANGSYMNVPATREQAAKFHPAPVDVNHPVDNQSVLRQMAGGLIKPFTGTAALIQSDPDVNAANFGLNGQGGNPKTMNAAPTAMQLASENSYLAGANTQPGVVSGVSNMAAGLPNMMAGPAGALNAAANVMGNRTTGAIFNQQVNGQQIDPDTLKKTFEEGGAEYLTTRLFQSGLTGNMAKPLATQLAPKIGLLPASVLSRLSIGALTMGDKQIIDNVINDRPTLENVPTAAATGGLMEAGGGIVHDAFSGKNPSPVAPGATNEGPKISPSEVKTDVTEAQPQPKAPSSPLKAQLPVEDQTRVSDLEQKLAQVNMSDVPKGPKPPEPFHITEDQVQYKSPQEATREQPVTPEGRQEAANIFERMKNTNVNERRLSDQPVPTEHRFNPTEDQLDIKNPSDLFAKQPEAETKAENEPAPEQAMKTSIGRTGMAQRVMDKLGLSEDAKKGQAYIQTAKAGAKAREAGIVQNLQPFRDAIKDIPFKEQLELSDEIEETGRSFNDDMDKAAPMIRKINGDIQKRLSQVGKNTFGYRTNYLGREAIGEDKPTTKGLLGPENWSKQRTQESALDWYKAITEKELKPSNQNIIDMHMGVLAKIENSIAMRQGLQDHLESGYAKKLPVDADIPAGYKALPAKLAEDPIINQQDAEDVIAGEKKVPTHIVVPEAFADQVENYMKTDTGRSPIQQLMDAQRKVRYMFDFFTAGRSIIGAASEPLNLVKGRAAVDKLADLYSDDPDKRVYAEHLVDAIKKSGLRTKALPEAAKPEGTKDIFNVVGSKIGQASRTLVNTVDKEISGPIRIGGALSDIDIAEKEGMSPDQAQQFLTRQRQTREAILGHSSDVNTMPGSIQALNHAADLAFPTYRYHLAGATAGAKGVEGLFKGQGIRSRTASAQLAIKPLMMIAAASAVTMRAATGQWPSSLQDVFQPRIGVTNKDGTERRIDLPSPYRGSIDSAIRVLKTLSLGPEFDADFDPFLKAFAESATNRESFTGNPIGDLSDRVGHVAKAFASPILPTQLQPDNKNTKWEPPMAAQLAGVKGAPSADERSTEQNQAIESREENKGRKGKKHG